MKKCNQNTLNMCIYNLVYPQKYLERANFPESENKIGIIFIKTTFNVTTRPPLLAWYLIQVGSLSRILAV